MSKRELSRAEIARQRRAQRAASELTKTRKRATTPIIQPVTRRVTPTVHKTTFVQTQKKRRFQIALGLPEVQLRKPNSGRQNQTSGRSRLASLGIVLVLGLIVGLALFLPYFNVSSVEVLGNDRLTSADIAGASGALGQSIFTVNPKLVETQLRIAYPELLSAQASVNFPNYVSVTVQERKPVILWQQKDSYTWIDADGVAFRPRGNMLGLIPVTGLVNPPQGTSDNPLIPPAYMQKDLVDAILALAPDVPADSTLMYDGTYGLGWQDSRGWKVFFGAESRNMPLKIRVYQSLAQSLVSRNISPAFINVAYPEAPYYRMTAETEYQPVSNGQ